jgi:uncharacterized protein (TIGR02145 family)
MIQNSKEGTYSQTTYKVKTKGERGYYYEWADAAKKSGNQYTACPPGYTLPTDKQWEALGSYLSSASATAAEKGYWFNTDNRAGLYSSVSSWDKWNNYGYWWSADGNDHQYYTSITNTVKHLSIVKDLLSVSVRCIRN